MTKIFEELLNSPQQSRERVLVDFLQLCIAPKLHLAIGDLAKDKSFFDLGLTSLMAVEVKYNIEDELKLKLRSTVLFDYPTLEKLTKYLTSEKLTQLFTKQQETEDLSAEDDIENLAKSLLSDCFDV